MRHSRVGIVTSDQCEYGLSTPDANGVHTRAKKPTRWMSSSPYLLQRLSRRCKGDHVHQHLVGGRAKAAKDDPTELTSDILRGMRDTADAAEDWGDSNGKEVVTSMNSPGLMHDCKRMNLAAAYQAEEAPKDTENLSVRFKHADDRKDVSNLTFKERYRDEYTTGGGVFKKPSF